MFKSEESIYNIHMYMLNKVKKIVFTVDGIYNRNMWMQLELSKVC